MSTLIEIQNAVAQLPGDERKALQLWLNSQGESALSAQEEQRLLRSLDEAMREIDAPAVLCTAAPPDIAHKDGRSAAPKYLSLHRFLPGNAVDDILQCCR